jgi:hypothetical protein
MYLLENVVAKIESAMGDKGFRSADFKAALSNPDGVYDSKWVDIAGQLMPKQRLADLEDAIEAGKIDTIEAFGTSMKTIHDSYQADEWAWVCRAYEQVFGESLATLDTAKIEQVATALGKVKTKFLNLVAADAQKEFSELSHIGFGQDGNQEDVAADFRAVRGTYEENPFVQEIRGSVARLKQRIEEIVEEQDAKGKM